MTRAITTHSLARPPFLEPRLDRVQLCVNAGALGRKTEPNPQDCGSRIRSVDFLKW